MEATISSLLEHTRELSRELGSSGLSQEVLQA
jgi:hypothetical protein